MAFLARCPVCHVKVRFADASREGASVACPRCKNYFTAAPEDEPLAAGPSLLHSHLPTKPAGSGQQERGAAESESRQGTSEPWAARTEGRARPKWLNPWGAVAVFCGGFGLFSASAWYLTGLALPLLVACLVLGLVGYVIAADKKAAILPAAAGAIGLPALVVAWFFPDLLGPVWAQSRAKVAHGPDRQFSIPRKGNAEQQLNTSPSTWVDSSKEGIKQGPVQVNIHKAVIAPVELTGAVPEKLSREKFLQLFVRILHVGTADVVEYKSWGARGSGVQLKDDQGQAYQPFTFPAGIEVKGRFARAALAGGHGPVYDVLVFQPPPKDRAYLLLSLPGSALGLPGSLRFKIPASAITEGPVLEPGAVPLVPKKTAKR